MVKFSFNNVNLRIVEAKNNKLDEVSYYILSLNTLVEKLMNIASEHWKIVSMYWLIDSRCFFF